MAESRPAMSEELRRWRMVEALGLLVVALSLFVVLPINGAVIPPVLIIGLIYLALAVVVWRFRSNGRVAVGAAVLALLGLVGNAPFLMSDLSHAESWGSFMPAAVSVVAGLTAAAAGLLPLVLRAPRGPSIVAALGGSATVALLLMSAVATLTAESDEAQADDTVIAAEGAEFPEAVEASAGSVGFFLENHDPVRHTFVIEDADVKVEMPAGKDRRVEVELAAGEYSFICDVPGHEAMEGVLTVR